MISRLLKLVKNIQFEENQIICQSNFNEGQFLPRPRTQTNGTANPRSKRTPYIVCPNEAKIRIVAAKLQPSTAQLCPLQDASAMAALNQCPDSDFIDGGDVSAILSKM